MTDMESEGGVNRRAYARLPVRLDARLKGDAWLERLGRIRDFCPGGVFLGCRTAETDPAVESLPPDDPQLRVTVGFEIEDLERPETFSLEARVARAFDAGLGLAFLEPDAAALAALQRLADRQNAERAVSAVRNPKIAGVAREEIVQECRLFCANSLAELLESFSERAKQHLAEVAREVTNAGDREQFTDATSALERERNPLRERLDALIGQHFDELGQPPVAVNAPGDSPESGGLSLVGKDEFEDFLVVSELSAKLESVNDAVLLSINHRFDNVADTRILNDNNPVGPLAVCHAFRAAVQSLSLSDEANVVMNRAFSEEVSEWLSDFYHSLDQLLDDRGLSAEPSYDSVVTSENIRSSRESALATDTPALADEPVSSVEAFPSQESVSVHETALTEGASTAFDSGFSQALPPPITHSRPAAPHQIGASAAVGAAQALMGIQRAQYSSGDSGAHQEFTFNEILSAISLLPQAGLTPNLSGASGVADGVGGSFKDQVLAMLGDQSGGAEKRIGDEVLDSIELIENLFEAFGEDLYLAKQTKPRILRLEPAVQRTSLVDPSLLTQREHPIRLFLNALDEIDPSAGGDNERTEVAEIIDEIIERVITESEHQPTAFNRAHDQLKTVLEGQAATYEANIARVIQMSSEQQSFLKQRRAEPDDDRLRDEGAVTSSQEWNVWLSRAMRLQVGDDVEFDEGRQGGVRQQLRLAWVGENHNPFVFVNRLGEKEASLSLPELAMNLRRGLTIVRDRSELPLFDRAMYKVLHRMHGRIEHTATRDRLTGVDNRRSFEVAIGRAMKRAMQEPDLTPVLAVFRFEGLANADEQGGEAARASVLQQAMVILKNAVDESATVGVVDEATYGVLLGDADFQELSEEFQSLRGNIDGHAYDWDGEQYVLRTCIGLVSIGGQIESEGAAIVAALEACEVAAGLDERLHVVTSEQEDASGAARMGWVSLINRTLRQDLMQLRCQLVKPLGDPGKPYYEVLLGLQDDEGDPISAIEFIAPLEYYEQMAALDRWVIRNTLKWMAANRKAVRQVAGFTIKLTERTLQDDDLMEYVLEQLTSTSVPPGKVCFEITQAHAETYLEQTGRLVRTLREFGCRFSLSKFGTGNTNHEELGSLPVDFVKVDGRFVRGMANNNDDQAVVQSVTHLAHAWGMRTVAEFVEDADLLETLEALGVDLVQGMAIAAPVYLSELGSAPVDVDVKRRGVSEDDVSAGAGAVKEGLAGESTDGWEDALTAFLELDDDLGSQKPGRSPGRG